MGHCGDWEPISAMEGWEPMRECAGTIGRGSLTAHGLRRLHHPQCTVAKRQPRSVVRRCKHHAGKGPPPVQQGQPSGDPPMLNTLREAIVMVEDVCPSCSFATFTPTHGAHSKSLKGGNGRGCGSAVKKWHLTQVK